MRLAKSSLALLASMLLFVGLLAGSALAQDGDGYPVDVDDRVITDDDVTVSGDGATDRLVAEDGDVAILGQRLAMTGAHLLLLLLTGFLLAASGALLLARSRSRRTHA
jgi:hypothetical protein